MGKIYKQDFTDDIIIVSEVLQGFVWWLVVDVPVEMVHAVSGDTQQKLDVTQLHVKSIVKVLVVTVKKAELCNQQQMKRYKVNWQRNIFKICSFYVSMDVKRDATENIQGWWQ